MLNRETILEALRQLSERLQVREVVGEINLLSGTALVLGFQARQSAKDVDAIFARVRIVREDRAVAESEDLHGRLCQGWGQVCILERRQIYEIKNQAFAGVASNAGASVQLTGDLDRNGKTLTVTKIMASK
jgi:hypothetical protein